MDQSCWWSILSLESYARAIRRAAEGCSEAYASAVPESVAKQFPNAPLVVDATNAATQFGLRPAQIEALVRAFVPGIGQ